MDFLLKSLQPNAAETTPVQRYGSLFIALTGIMYAAICVVSVLQFTYFYNLTVDIYGKAVSVTIATLSVAILVMIVHFVGAVALRSWVRGWITKAQTFILAVFSTLLFTTVIVGSWKMSVSAAPAAAAMVYVDKSGENKNAELSAAEAQILANMQSARQTTWKGAMTRDAIRSLAASQKQLNELNAQKGTATATATATSAHIQGYLEQSAGISEIVIILCLLLKEIIQSIAINGDTDGDGKKDWKDDKPLTPDNPPTPPNDTTTPPKNLKNYPMTEEIIITGSDVKSHPYIISPNSKTSDIMRNYANAEKDEPTMEFEGIQIWENDKGNIIRIASQWKEMDQTKLKEYVSGYAHKSRNVVGDDSKKLNSEKSRLFSRALKDLYGVDYEKTTAA